MSHLAAAPHEAQRLSQLIQAECLNIPLEHWGYFFPGAVAIWRFVQEIRPDLLGELSAGYSAEPWFRGRGAAWFTSTLIEAPGVVVELERVMRHTATHLPSAAWDRGFVRSGELPAIESGSVEALLVAVTAALPPQGAV